MLLKMGLLFPQMMLLIIFSAFDASVASIDAVDNQRELQQVADNWDITYVNSSIDLSNSNNIDTTYEIGKDRAYMTYLLANDCESPITGITDITPTELRTNKDEYHDILNVKYSIPLALITSSNIWNPTTEQLIFCQVVQLVHPYPDNPSPLMISERKWVFTVDINFTANFSTSSELTAGLVVTTFQGSLELANFIQPSSPEDAQSIREVLSETIKEVVNGLLPENSGTSVTSVTILSNLGGFARRRMNKWDMLLPHEDRILQESIEYEVVLSETCDSTETCDGTTPIYDDVSAGLTQEIESGGFTTTLQENAKGTPIETLIESTVVEGGTTTEPDVEVVGASSGEVQVVDASAELTSYIEAYTCGGTGVMTVNADSLAPNEDLFVCVRSTSTDVEIESLDKMDIAGTDSTGNTETLKVINGGTVSFPAFTSVQEVSVTERQVLTRVPANLFDYNAQDASIRITGSVTMKLSGSGRMLRVDFETNAVDGFDFNIILRPVETNMYSSSTTIMHVWSMGSIMVCTAIAFVNVI